MSRFFCFLLFFHETFFFTFREGEKIIKAESHETGPLLRLPSPKVTPTAAAAAATTAAAAAFRLLRPLLHGSGWP